MTLSELLLKVERAKAASNSLDVEIAVALFAPDELYASARPNAAGTKVIYTTHSGRQETFWSGDYTLTQATRESAAKALRALITQQKDATP